MLIAWPHAATDWKDRLRSVEATYVELVAAIARFQRVVVCCANAEVQRRAQARLASATIGDHRR